MDMKKWFRRKNQNETPNNNESGIYKFLDKEGFYIVLFLCVCIVATTAVWVTKTNIDRLAKEDIVPPPDITNYVADGRNMEEDLLFVEEDMEEIEKDESPTIVIEDMDEGDESIPTVAAQPQEDNSSQSQTAPPKLVDSRQEEPQEEEVADTVASAMVMTVPLEGELGMKYAMETLTYSKTLDQFTTHSGIDIKAPLDSPVMAALDGEVIEVLVDSRLGLTIAIAHENETITRYSNLSTDEMVKVGDWVEKGQVISGVGQSALFEISEDPHLHFEVLVDGEYVDPSLYVNIGE